MCETCRVAELVEGLMNEIEKLHKLVATVRETQAPLVKALAVSHDNLLRASGLLRGRGCSEVCELNPKAKLQKGIQHGS